MRSLSDRRRAADRPRARRSPRRHRDRLRRNAPRARGHAASHRDALILTGSGRPSGGGAARRRAVLEGLVGGTFRRRPRLRRRPAPALLERRQGRLGGPCAGRLPVRTSSSLLESTTATRTTGCSATLVSDGLAATAWCCTTRSPSGTETCARSRTTSPLSPDQATAKAALLDEAYPSQHVHDWWDEETFLGLMRLRGVECRSRYAEGFVSPKTVLGFD